MPQLLVLLVCALFLGGCAKGGTRTSFKPQATFIPPPGGAAQPKALSSAPATPQWPLAGQISSVNSRLRYVVVEFLYPRLPELGQRMFVYRSGQKIAELKISGPFRGKFVAADFAGSDLKIGDEVRAD